jgi:hypothetical protein
VADALPKRSIREAARDRDSYGFLLILVLIDYLALILVGSTRWSGLSHAVPVSLTVLLALHTSGAWHRTVRLAQIAVVVSIAAGVAQEINGNRENGAVASWFAALLLVISTVAVLRRILRHNDVTLETIFGAVSVYVMIGLIFSFVYVGIGHISDTQFFVQTKDPSSSDYAYFSFIVLTTVGFGDYTPLTSVARSTVVLEALMGQVFLVTLVARLVSMYNANDPRSARTRTRPSVDQEQWEQRRRTALGGWFAGRRPDASQIDPDPNPELGSAPEAAGPSDGAPDGSGEPGAG